MKGHCIMHALSLCDSLILNSGGSVQCLLFYLSKDHCILLNLQMQGFWQSMSQPVPDSPFRRWVQNASRRCFPCATLQREFYQLSHLLQEQQPFTGAWHIWYSHFSIFFPWLLSLPLFNHMYKHIELRKRSWLLQICSSIMSHYGLEPRMPRMLDSC